MSELARTNLPQFYSNELLSCGHGAALWKPEPSHLSEDLVHVREDNVVQAPIYDADSLKVQAGAGLTLCVCSRLASMLALSH